MRVQAHPDLGWRLLCGVPTTVPGDQSSYHEGVSEQSEECKLEMESTRMQVADFIESLILSGLGGGGGECDRLCLAQN